MDNNIKDQKIETPPTPPAEEPVKEPEVEDESELDKELEESIEAVKAGKELSPTKEEAKPEEPPVETPPEGTPPEEPKPEEPKVEDPSTPPAEPSGEEEKPEGYDYRIPNKGKFESDESYEKRIELLDLVNKRKLAKTDEQKQQLSEDIKKAKSNLKTLNGTDRFVNPLNEKKEDEPTTPVEKTDEEKALEADKERLKQLGGATKEDIEEIVKRERLAADVKNTLDTFIDRHEELKDEDAREVFFDFVDNNYKWQGKSGKDLMTVLELARESMFKPSETIQDRVLKGANVQEKVNAMQFPGGSVAKTDFSPEMQKSIDELKATGMSEEKAIELLSD